MPAYNLPRLKHHLGFLQAEVGSYKKVAELFGVTPRMLGYIRKNQRVSQPLADKAQYLYDKLVRGSPERTFIIFVQQKAASGYLYSKIDTRTGKLAERAYLEKMYSKIKHCEQFHVFLKTDFQKLSENQKGKMLVTHLESVNYEDFEQMVGDI